MNNSDTTQYDNPQPLAWPLEVAVLRLTGNPDLKARAVAKLLHHIPTFKIDDETYIADSDLTLYITQRARQARRELQEENRQRVTP